jgi:FixJ family two-component response regulator
VLAFGALTMEVLRRVITVDDERLAKRAARGLVSVVDDDPGVLLSLRALIEYEGYACHTYASVTEFLAASGQPRFPGPRCILSDMYMPDLDGLKLQASLSEESDQPIVFMSGMGQVEQVAQAFRKGAVHFLSKPISDSDLFHAIHEALLQSVQIQQIRAQKKLQIERMAKLTPRERELAQLLPEGLSIKEMADNMDVSDRAIKLYKKNLMEKLEVKSIFELMAYMNNGFL